MKTKGIMILAATLLIFASEIRAQGFGVRAGVNFQNVNGKDNEGDQLENNLTPGFNIGVNYEVPVGTDIYFQPGLLFSTKGTKSDFTLLSQDFNSKLSLSYIEVPLNIIFKPLLGSGHMLLGFGPYVAYGIGGKYKLEAGGVEDETDVTFQGEVSESESESDAFFVKPFDAGANFIIGYEMASMLSLQLNAQLGLLDIYPDQPEEDNTVWKNTGFGLSLGYRF
jgi:hypothetical protein